MDIMLVSGVPASGKSHFGSWLERKHSFLHLDVEKDGRLASHGLLEAWEACFRARNVERLVSSLRKIGRPIALNWGFPPQWLSVVRLFKAAGVVLWWFDADHAAARKAFLARGDVPVEAFNVQMAEIKRTWPEIKATFDPNILVTLRSDGSRLVPEAIYEVLFGGKDGLA